MLNIAALSSQGEEMTKSSRASEPTRGASNKKASTNSAKSRPNHDSHQFVGARDFDPALDVPNDETEERRELEPWLRVIEPPERGRPQILIRRSLNSGDFEALFVLELASVVATGFGAAEQGHRTTAKIPPSDMVSAHCSRAFARVKAFSLPTAVAGMNQAM